MNNKRIDKDVTRILVIRLSGIGDVVMASALIPVLRRHWPDARIDWLVQPASEPLLRYNPRLDHVITWDRDDWRGAWRQWQLPTVWHKARAFAQALREARYDLVIDLQGLLKSGVWAWLSGAPQRIGLGAKEGSQWLMTRRMERGGDPERIGSEYLYLAEQLGLDVDGFPMDIVTGNEEREQARSLVHTRGIGDGYAVICPFTTRPQKHWFEERWAQLAARLGLPTIMLGGTGDRTAAQRIVEAGGSGLHNLAGQSTLAQAVALIEGASLVVGVDTGLTHMGIAFDRPTVALFGSTCPYLKTGSPHAQVLYDRLECSPCKRHPTCNGAFTCMQQHTVDRVARTAAELLESAA